MSYWKKVVKMNNKFFTNNLDQPIGELISSWTNRQFPPHTTMEGQYCTINILDVVKHGEDLFNAFTKDINNQDWTYLPYGPFETKKEFFDWLQNFRGAQVCSTLWQGCCGGSTSISI